MDKQAFWQLINDSVKAAAGDQALKEQWLIENLAKMTPEEIIDFECILREYLIEADDFSIMAVQKIVDGWVTDDPYLYFRCWLIGQGEAVFTNALREPDTLAEVIEEPYSDFEGLLYATTKAFEQLTGREEDESFPRDIASSRGLNYDFGVETKGEDWTEEQLPALLPKLWARFGE